MKTNENTHSARLVEIITKYKTICFIEIDSSGYGYIIYFNLDKQNYVVRQFKHYKTNLSYKYFHHHHYDMCKRVLNGMREDDKTSVIESE